ncbi:FtsX-like permease family protein [Acinetobacter sp. B5B]|uniref:ABC transporter permease n=1 Tax=Acinetobacter baretiae TaxID=2605383 RepID=UPI0018C2BBDE|nr:FtsX-like permease family protein [Acinetobacter baretiae]MBF7682051.1 FtsX-like permease family protein [Acinetobacter baretiae]MBF7684707.1 FtsX-like permease family protein [Acinetobacter baretiae]
MNHLIKPLLQQSFRSQSSWLLMVALSLAICATTALNLASDQVKRAINLQAADLLAADVVLNSNQPLDQKYREEATAQGLTQSQVTVFSTMASTDHQFVMVLVKAIEPNFPLRGTLVVEPHTQKTVPKGDVWLSPRAQDLLGVKLGDTVNIADAQLRFSAIIEKDSNQETGFSAFSPLVLMNQDDVNATQAIQQGSRIDYRLLLSSSQNAPLTRYQQWFDAQQQKMTVDHANEVGVVKLKDAKNSNTRLLKPIENLEKFLQLSNLLTVLLCGLAIALSTQRYVQQNQDYIALMRCLGASKKDLLIAFFSLMALVMFCSAWVGSALGIGLGYGLLQLMLQFIPQVNIDIAWGSVLLEAIPIAFLTSGLVLLGFVFPKIYQLLTTPPIKVLRAISQLNIYSMITVCTGFLSLAILGVILTQSVGLTVQVLLGMGGLAVVMYGLLWLLFKGIKQLKNTWSTYVRTAQYSALQVTALSLGLSLIAVLIVLRTDVLSRWQAELPNNTPNQFVYGLPPTDEPDFLQDLQKKGWSHTTLYPNIRGRLIAKNGQGFSEQETRSNESLQRELNLTQAQQYPSDNKILQGDLAFKGVQEVSVEQEVAKKLNIQIGDQLTFSLPEGQINAKVINVRSVQWQSFNPNFYFIFSPNTFDRNAGSYLGSFFVPTVEKSQLLPLIQHYNTTVFIDISLILDQVKQLMSVMVKIMTVLALLVALSGFLVLMACINILIDERKKEVALWRAFGSTKANIRRMMTIEFACIGFTSGLTACLFAELIGFIASRQIGLSPQLHLELWLILPVIMTVLCAVIGRYRLNYLSNIAPLQSLRQID